MGQNSFEFPFHENGNRRNIYDRKLKSSVLTLSVCYFVEHFSHFKS